MPQLAFLFTDIEDSTAKWESDHRAMSRALLQHDRLLGEAVRMAHGRIVKHTGDGVFAAVPAKKGLACALDIQRRIGAARWEPFNSFRVRIGVHVGAATERDGDYFGPVINCAARIMAKAGGGQVLASQEAVREGALPPPARTQEAGLFSLKGIDKPQRLHHVLHPDLQQHLQAPRPDEAARWSLPEAPAPLLGREADLAAAEAFFLAQHAGSFTVVGEPGAGKTRFGLELARRLGPRFGDGACFVDLGVEDSRDNLGLKVGQALGLSLGVNKDPEQLTIDFLAHKQLLLVLDPFDQLASKALFISRLLQRAPDVRVLATSTWPLSLKEECAWTLPPLTRGPGGGARQVLQGELDRLGKALDEAQAEALIDAVGGNALGLRLTASLLEQLGGPELLRCLQELRDQGLREPPVGIGLGLAAAFECSWRQLDEVAQQKFARLAVFRPGFSLEAAHAVAGLDPATAVRLLRRGLLSMEHGNYSLGDPLRRLTRVKMEAEAGARFKASIAHRDHYLGYLRDHGQDLQSGPQKAALIHSLDQDYANVREAWRRACETDAFELLAAASIPLGQYFDFRTRNREGAYLFGMAIERFEVQGRSKAVAELYMQRANSLAYFGKADESLHLLNLSLDYWRAAGDRAKEAVALTHRANIAGSAGDFYGQVETAREALLLWQGLGDPKGVAWSTGQQALGYLRLGRLQMARELGEEALALYEQVADPAGQLWIMGVVAETAFNQGDIETARQLCYRSLELARPLDAAWAIAGAYMQLATIAELQSSNREARHFLQRAQEQFASMGREAHMAFNLRNLLAQVHIALGHYGEASALLAQSLDPSQAPDNSQDLGWPMNLLAQLRVLQGDFKGAQDICEQGIADPRLHTDGGSWFRENLAASLMAQGQTPEALALLEEAKRVTEATGRLRGTAWGHNRLAVVQLATGRLAEARANLWRARELHLQLGEPQGVASDDLALARLERLEGDPSKAAALAEGVAQAYITFAMPRGIALAHMELGACLLALGAPELAREPFTIALRQAAACGAWPVYYRALRRLAEVRAQEGSQALAVQALSFCLVQEGCEAENKEAARALMGALMKELGARAYAVARDKGKGLTWRLAAAVLGVSVPEHDPAAP